MRPYGAVPTIPKKNAKQNAETALDLELEDGLKQPSTAMVTEDRAADKRFEVSLERGAWVREATSRKDESGDTRNLAYM